MIHVKRGGCRPWQVLQIAQKQAALSSMCNHDRSKHISVRIDASLSRPEEASLAVTVIELVKELVRDVDSEVVRVDVGSFIVAPVASSDDTNLVDVSLGFDIEGVLVAELVRVVDSEVVGVDVVDSSDSKRPSLVVPPPHAQQLSVALVPSTDG